MKPIASTLITLLLLSPFILAQQTIDVSVQGISDGQRDSQQKDRDEAILDAKLKAIERAGVSIEAVTVMENFKLKSDWVEAKAKGVILPGFQIIDIGYGEDGLYHVVLTGKVSKTGERAPESEGDKKFRMAMLYLDNDKSKALQMMQEVVDNYRSCASADDALYYLITKSHFDEQSANDRLIQMKAYYRNSPFIVEAQTWISNKKEEIKRAQEAARKRISRMFQFVHIPGGTFMMGSRRGDEPRYNDEVPQHQVNVAPFCMMTTEVTQAQRKAVMGSNPSHFKGDNLPVEQVSWNDCREFINELNQMDPGKGYRLPTEAEWEYACRAGTTTRFYSGNSESDLARVGWYSGNSEGKTHPVGGKEPNAWGLYDMHGNVWEWCQDKYHGNYFGAPSNGSAWVSGSGSDRVIRGGSWYDNSSNARCASCNYHDPTYTSSYYGFRCARNP